MFFPNNIIILDTYNEIQCEQCAFYPTNWRSSCEYALRGKDYKYNNYKSVLYIFIQGEKL